MLPCHQAHLELPVFARDAQGTWRRLRDHRQLQLMLQHCRNGVQLRSRRSPSTSASMTGSAIGSATGSGLKTSTGPVVTDTGLRRRAHGVWGTRLLDGPELMVI
jgi:hypothetical protein